MCHVDENDTCGLVCDNKCPMSPSLVVKSIVTRSFMWVNDAIVWATLHHMFSVVWKQRYLHNQSLSM